MSLACFALVVLGREARMSVAREGSTIPLDVIDPYDGTRIFDPKSSPHIVILLGHAKESDGT